MTVFRQGFFALLMGCIVVLSGCKANIEDYAQAQPKLDIFTWFAGDSVAYGMVQDHSNKQTRRFTVKIRADRRRVDAGDAGPALRRQHPAVSGASSFESQQRHLHHR